MKRLVGERRAIAAAVLVLYAFLYLVMTLIAPPEWGRAMGAMAAVYGIGFFALVAGYFWARWYAVGIALSGLISGAISMWQMGPEPVLLFVSGTHAAAALLLWGDAMAATFDGRESWRARFSMDEHAVSRLGNAVIRLGISLPFVLLYALAPKPAPEFLALGAAALAAAGLYGLVRLRTWGVFAVAGSAVALTASAIGSFTSGCVCSVGSAAPTALMPGGAQTIALALGAVALLTAASLEFAPAIRRFIGSRSAR